MAISGDNNLYIVGATYSVFTPTEQPAQVTGPVYFNPFLNGPQSGFISRFDLDQVTSTDEQLSVEKPFRLFPNPVGDKLNLRFEQYQEEVKLTIIDLNGRILSSQMYRGKGSIISLEAPNLSRGMYLLQIQTNKLTTTQAFIKE